MVQIFNLKQIRWTSHVLQNPEHGGRNKKDYILGKLLKVKGKGQSIPTYNLVLSSLNNMNVQLIGKICLYCLQWFPRSICLEQWLNWQAIRDRWTSMKKIEKRKKRHWGSWWIYKIPSRSPDFTPTKNVFNLTTKLLNWEAVEKKTH